MFDAVSVHPQRPRSWGNVVLARPVRRATSQNHALPAVTWLVDQDQNSEHPDLTSPA